LALTLTHQPIVLAFTEATAAVHVIQSVVVGFDKRTAAQEP
jgi:hypothetical protein